MIAGSAGGIGGALFRLLATHPEHAPVVGLHRSSDPPLDLADEESMANAARTLAERGVQPGLVVIATGLLGTDRLEPEKSLKNLNAEQLLHLYKVNAVGPALLLKYLLPLLPSRGRLVIASLSARVGSIGDNRLGGWYSYRASKAALNQLMHTAAIELRRHNPSVICVTLHPGTVATALSAKFEKKGLNVQTPEDCASRLLAVIDGLKPSDNGGFFDYNGDAIPW